MCVHGSVCVCAWELGRVRMRAWMRGCVRKHVWMAASSIFPYEENASEWIEISLPSHSSIALPSATRQAMIAPSAATSHEPPLQSPSSQTITSFGLRAMRSSVACGL